MKPENRIVELANSSFGFWTCCFLGGLFAKQCRDHPREKLPPIQFQLSPKAVLRNPKVEFAMSKSSFCDYIIAKVL